MPFTYTKLLSDCLIALGDPTATTWSRTATIMPWTDEAMLAFPILRPMLLNHAMAATGHNFALPSDFREVINVEYPINQVPPCYLTRKNELDPDFYSIMDCYDVTHDYKSGLGWFMYISNSVLITEHVYVYYLANHLIGLADDNTDEITIPDEYENIITAYVVAKGYRERLGAFMQDPTAHSSVIQQMTDMVHHAEDNYDRLVDLAVKKLVDSRITPQMHVDKHDRVY